MLSLQFPGKKFYFLFCLLLEVSKCLLFPSSIVFRKEKKGNLSTLRFEILLSTKFVVSASTSFVCI